MKSLAGVRLMRTSVSTGSADHRKMTTAKQSESAAPERARERRGQRAANSVRLRARPEEQEPRERAHAENRGGLRFIGGRGGVRGRLRRCAEHHEIDDRQEEAQRREEIEEARPFAESQELEGREIAEPG